MVFELVLPETYTLPVAEVETVDPEFSTEHITYTLPQFVVSLTVGHTTAALKTFVV